MSTASKPATTLPTEYATREAWRARGLALFGPDEMSWRFVCPACKHVATVRDWMDAGAPEGAVIFSCVGRWVSRPVREAFGNGPGPCNYAGGGLIGLNPVLVRDGVREYRVFQFAPLPQETTVPETKA